jgi:tRNA A37 threonylcarbamoyladenosine biosynthesis protein TsaE
VEHVTDQAEPTMAAPDLVLGTVSADQTRLVARAMAPLCAPGDVLLVSGDLGAGKTTFAQGFGAGLGVVEAITSPTFTLVRQYPVAPPLPGADHGAYHPGVHVLVHADLYRLEHLHEVADLALDEVVEDGGVAVIEWGDGAAPLLGAGSLAVRLAVDVDHDHHRVITLRPADGSWAGRWTALRAAVAPWLVAR